MNKFECLNCCVLIPTYNNCNTIKKVVNGVLNYTTKIIIVNDGSTDNTKEILKQFEQIEIISYKKNKGKGHALKQGFKKALEMGFDYAITIDSDGQHDTDELPLFLEACEKNSEAIIIGARSFKNIKDLPSKNNFANNFSNFWFHFQTGLKLDDTQSGYRLYPLKLFKKHRYYSKKYEFELEVIVRAAWKGIDIVSIPIIAYYPPKEQRVTHFRPFKDFFRISVLNTILTTLSIAFYIPRNFIRKYRKRKIKDIIKEDILSGNTSNGIIAISIGFGVFMGIVPIWGYQLAIGFLLAFIFKLNKSIFFLAANISFPPFIPFILYLSYVTGSFVLGKGSWHIDFDLNLESIKSNLLQYIIGSIVLAIVAGCFFGSTSYLILQLIKKNKK